MPEQDEFGGLAVEDSPVTPPAAREVSKDEFGGISLDDEALQFATTAPQQVTNTLTRTLRSGAEGSEMAREAPRNRLEAAYEALALPPGAQEGRERMAGGYGYSESLLPIPTFTPKEGEPGYMTVGKEVANIALGLPKFLTSPTGITAAPLGFVAPTITAGAFTEDMLNSLGEQAANTYKNWGSMSPTQKTAAVTQMAGTGLFAGLTGAATVKGLRQPPAVGPRVAPRAAPRPAELPPEQPMAGARVPITPGPIEPKPLPTAEAEATEAARLAAELGQEEEPAPAPTPPPAPAPAPAPPAAPAKPEIASLGTSTEAIKDSLGNPLGTKYYATPEDWAKWQELSAKRTAAREAGNVQAMFEISPQLEALKNKYGGAPPEPPKTATPGALSEVHKEGIEQGVALLKEAVGLREKEARRLVTAKDLRETIEDVEIELGLKFTPEERAIIGAGHMPDLEGAPGAIIESLKPSALTQEAKITPEQKARLQGRLKRLRDEGVLGPAYTGPDAVVISGKPLGEWFKVTKAEELPKGSDRAALAKRIGVANQPKKILAALKNSQKRIREIVSPPLKPEDAIPAPAVTPETPPQAAAKVEDEVSKVAAVEGQRPAKEVKTELVSRLEKAIEEAPSEEQAFKDAIEKAGATVSLNADKYAKQKEDIIAGKQIPTVTIDIPGDGRFTIVQTKENLTELLGRAKRLSTSPGAPVKVRKEGVSKADKEWIDEQLKQTPPTGPVGMGAAVTEEFEHNPSTPTGIRNAVVDKERAKRGLPEAMQAAKRSFGEVWDRAMAIIDRDPVAQDNLLNELRDKPRALTDTEDALILHRQIDLQNEYGKATRDLAQAFDDGRMDAVATEKVRVASLADKLLEVYNIGKTSGTETARGLSARRMMANEDFSLAKMVTEKRAANGGKPLTEAQNAEIERLNKIIEATQKALDDYKKRADERRGGGQKPSQPPAPDPEVEKIRADNERSKRLYREGLMRDRLRNRTPLEKTQDWIVKWRRAFILSSPITLAKLTSAAAERMAITPLEEAAGSLIGRAIPSVAAKASREGGISARAEARALTEGFTKGLRDSWEVLRTGRSSLDELYGRAAGYPPGVSDFFGHVHGALKSVPKRAEFARSFEKRAQQAIAQGVDVSDPLVQARLSVESYKDANRAIFQQDNRVVSAYKAALRTLEQKSKETGKVPTGSKAVATAGKILLPIVRIPTNIVAETLQTSTGLITGSARLGRAFARGIENLSPQEADIIMRSLKKGSLGAALLALGFFNPDVIGGYYQPGKRKPGQQGFGTVQLYGHEIPSYLLHNPLLETMQIGATARKLAESKISKKDAEAQGMGWGAFGAGMGLLEEVPFLREPIEIAKAFNPNERRAFMGELFKSLTVPQGVQWWAAYQDTDQYGQPIKRKPVTIGEHIKTGIPGLREEVPSAK